MSLLHVAPVTPEYSDELDSIVVESNDASVADQMRRLFNVHTESSETADKQIKLLEKDTLELVRHVLESESKKLIGFVPNHPIPGRKK